MPRRILIIRRDNIGDLILTTPLITALRSKLPEAHIAALVTAYNAPVLEGNAALNAVHFYTKGKHAGGFFAMLRARLKQAALFIRLRRESFDDIVLAEMGYLPRNIRLAKFIRGFNNATRIIGFEHENGASAGLDIVISKANTDDLQQAQYIFLIAHAFAIDVAPSLVPPCVVYPATQQPKSKRFCIGIHISARKPSQQWSADAFVALITQLHHHTSDAEITLFWSPGAIDNLLHPGDDAKAAEIIDTLEKIGVDVTPSPTATLRELINHMALVDTVVCADGGALHVAAGLGKPLVALFGDSEVKRWHPWGVKYVALQKPSLTVADISPDEVFAALLTLTATVAQPSAAPPGSSLTNSNAST